MPKESDLLESAMLTVVTEELDPLPCPSNTSICNPLPWTKNGYAWLFRSKCQSSASFAKQMTSHWDPKPAVVSGKLRAAHVNALNVQAPLHNASGATITADFSTPPNYIATQGPLDSTAADFLTMLYGQRVPHCYSIVHLRIKKGALTTFTSAAHIVTVILMEKSVKVDFTCRVFAFLPHDQKDPWTVHLALLAKYPLMLGVGRTGTFICSRFLLDQLLKDPLNIDIIGTTLAVRRPWIVS
ncbi:Receptor type tyrosine protein phosphatase O [Echinococcus multilocularis]|uniref:Receptor type tyrosine protein phosphatase O n=1 Tax=Echinococcus multilocularis TaxID=6211 RepID=A0A0S4MIT4_ECHMU|nr:Receptor type tyrosine protein phosphatase O [Echinococcus multilocularis]